MIRFILLFSLIASSAFSQEKNPDDVQFKVRAAKAKSRLKQIGTTYAMYFTDGVTVKIPTPEVAEVDNSIKTYIHPASGKSRKFLFIQPGYKYEGSSNLLLAVTDIPIDGKYMACFEDGHVSYITKEQFKKHLFIFGLKQIKSEFKELEKDEQKSIQDLISQLGAKKYKERKEAKAKLIEKGFGILGFMEKNKNHPDFETKVSIQEVIKELKKLAPKKLSKRPKL